MGFETTPKRQLLIKHQIEKKKSWVGAGSAQLGSATRMIRKSPTLGGLQPMQVDLLLKPKTCSREVNHSVRID